LGQSLTVLKLQVRAIERNLREDDQPELKQECRELLEYLDGVIENVRRLSRDLSPSILEDLGLLSALKYLLDGLGKHFTVRQSFEIEDLNSLFPTEAQIIIYRIFQECLNNITKHAGAREVLVAVRQDDGNVHFTLEDDGAGLTCSDLELMQSPPDGGPDERARMLGGARIWRAGAGIKIVAPSRCREKSDAKTLKLQTGWGFSRRPQPGPRGTKLMAILPEIINPEMMENIEALFSILLADDHDVSPGVKGSSALATWKWWGKPATVSNS
jgi:hypothetical protein